MAFDYGPKTARAAEKIAACGREVVFVSSEGEYDPIAGQWLGERLERAAMALLLKPDEKLLASGAIEIGDMALLVAGSSLKAAPPPNSVVEVDGEKWRVLSAETVAPAGEAVLYRVYIRRD